MELSQIENMLQDVFAFIDTVQVWTDRPLVNYERDTLEGLCHGKVIKSYKKMGFSTKWIERRSLQRPTSKAFKFLESLEIDYLINRVELSLDLITQSKVDALVVKEFIDDHIVHPWHGKQKVKIYEDTRYTGSRIDRRNIVTYADKPSKVNGQPCCHIDFRFHSANSVRLLGVYTMNDLYNFGHFEFWKKRLVLKYVDMEKLGKKILKKPHAKKPILRKYGDTIFINWALRVATIYCKNIANMNTDEKVHSKASIQQIIDYFTSKGMNSIVYKSLYKIDNTIFLPKASTLL